MNRNRRTVAIASAATIAVVVFFFWIVISGVVYAPGAHALQQKLSAVDDWNTFMSSIWFGESVLFVVRKAYGALAFAIIGACAAPIFAGPQRIRSTAALLGTLRLSIEIAERFRYGNADSILESAFDVATGACAGALGAYAYDRISRRFA